MEQGLNNLLAKLSKSIADKNFTDIGHEVIEEIEGRSDAFESVEPILKLMENNADFNFGKPGPLVHFVEKYYKNGYEEKLVESLQRHPTKHTLWMLNRIINGSENDAKEHYLNVLDRILEIHSLDDGTSELTKHFRSLHS